MSVSELGDWRRPNPVTGRRVELRIVRLAWLLLLVGVLTVACVGSEHRDEPDPRRAEIDVEGEFENTIYAFLSVAVDEKAAEGLMAEIDQVAPGAAVDFEPAQREFILAPGGSLDCPVWDGPSLRVSSDGDDTPFREVVDLLEAQDVVLAIDAPQLGIFLDEEEPHIECESRQVSILLSPSADIDDEGLVEEALVIEGVVAVAVGNPFGSTDLAVPDLSGYPEAEECYGPVYEQFTVYMAERDAAVSQSIVDRFSDLAGVEGFSGWDIDDSLDPILAWENRMYGEEGDGHFEECQGYEAYVRLEAQISDEDAARVAARAAAIPGVADVHLRLVEPGSIEGCEGRGFGGLFLGAGFHANGLIDCSAITSELTIYRGDKSRATPELISSELCDLPGVLEISVYDREGDQEFADPYETCGSLRLSVLLDSDVIGEDENSSELDPLFVELEESRIVSRFDGPYFADYEVYEQTVVYGAVDELLCLNTLEVAPTIGVDLVRTTRHEAEALAEELERLDVVVRVVGNAVDLQPWSPDVCGYDGLSLHLVRGGGDAEIAQVLAVLEGRDDIRAVVVEGETPHLEGDVDHGSWVLVKFNTESPPDDLEDLARRMGDLDSVAEAEAWHWVWDEE